MELPGLYLSRLISLGIWILLSIFPEILISAQNNMRTQNESRWDTYWDLVEEARMDMKSQIEQG